jgi:C-terminal processing protease CtpA/Prc
MKAQMNPARLLLLCSLLLLATACRKSKDEDNSKRYDARDAVYDVARAWYLWYDKLPTIDPNDYSDPATVMNALRYEAYDKWSYAVTQEEYEQYYEQGVYYGHGYSMSWDSDNQLRITKVYPGSPTDRAGITRGWTILAINGYSSATLATMTDWGEVMGENQAGVTNNFKLKDLKGETQTIALGKEQISIASVMKDTVLTAGNSKVGYMVYDAFIEKSFPEIDRVVANFLGQGVSDLVLDMRYNGGGQINVAKYLCSAIAGQAIHNEIFVSYTHNDKQNSENWDEKFDTTATYQLNLNRVFVITTDQTASASELVINSLDPFIDVILVGGDTHGKPVGMYGFMYDGWVIVPICFKTVNSQGTGEYFDGLPADGYVNDDLGHDFGDPEEACLKAALYYIENGGFPSTKKAYSPSMNTIPFKGLQTVHHSF